ncbi:MAG: tyrosine-type recombinase/integrase [Pyrinomonadaceae bacterium]
MTVRKRKDTGKWVSDFYYNGERIVRTLKFARTKKEAEQAEAVVMNQVFQQAYGFEAKPDKLFENFVVETFLPYSEANKKSFVSDVFICRVLVKEFRNRTLMQITPPIVETFKQEFLNTPTKYGKRRSPATVNNHLRILSKIFSLAVDAELVENNPCFRVKKLRLNNKRMRVLSFEEEVKLLGALADDNELIRNIVIVALHTGMRRGEIFNLKWFDLDFVRGLIKVEESKSGVKRIIPMNATIKSLLKHIDQKSEYVFPSPRSGGKLNDIKKGFCKAVAEIGIKDFRFHDLRHTAATRMADVGADAFTLAKILGHSSIQMTARYTHATDAAIRRAVENLDSFGNVLATERKTAAVILP